MLVGNETLLKGLTMNHAKLIGKPEGYVIAGEALEAMKKLSGRWAVYQNHDLGHPELGCLHFLAFGEGRTYNLPPNKYPDTQHGIGWRYQLVGEVDFSANPVVVKEYSGELFSQGQR